MKIKKYALIICGVLLCGMAKAQNTSDTTAVACGSFIWYETEYTETPIVAPTHIFEAADGSDSIVTLHLTINQPVEYEFWETACVSYTWNTETYTTSGDKTQTFIAANDCDSIVTLHLTVNQPVKYEFRETACNYYTWNGTEYTTSGDYQQVFIATNGCDSTVTLHLTINPPYKTTIIRKGTSNILICADSTSNAHYQWGFIDLQRKDTTLIVDYVNYRYYEYHRSETQDIDTCKYRYFVDIDYGTDGCKTRSYFNGGICLEPQLIPANTQQITVYPNPAKGHYSVALGAEVKGKVVVSLLSISGQTLLSKQITDYKNNEILQFDFNFPASGLYVLVVQTNKTILTSKIVIK